MTIDPVGQALHYRSARGETLTPEEQARLQQWYAKMDEEEGVMLSKAMEPWPDLDALKRRISDLERDIATTEEKIRKQEALNEVVRQQVESLSHLLANKQAAQSV